MVNQTSSSERKPKLYYQIVLQSSNQLCLPFKSDLLWKTQRHILHTHLERYIQGWRSALSPSLLARARDCSAMSNCGGADSAIFRPRLCIYPAHLSARPRQRLQCRCTLWTDDGQKLHWVVRCPSSSVPSRPQPSALR